jgi:hypothetical protein
MWKVISFMLLFSITSILALAQQTEPYKPDAEFEFKFDYSFKERMLNEKPDYQAQDPDKRPTSTGPLPYLKTELKLLTLNADEVRVKVVNHKGTTVINRKVTTNQVLKIDWGFSDDVKDQIVSHSYTIFLMNDDKEILSRITLNADTDGTFFVNGQKKGRL